MSKTERQMIYLEQMLKDPKLTKKKCSQIMKEWNELKEVLDNEKT